MVRDHYAARMLGRLILPVLLGIGLMPGTVPAQAPVHSSVETTVRQWQDEWETVLYARPEEEHADRFRDLLTRLEALEREHPGDAAPKVLRAMVLCTYAGTQIGIGTLDMIETARDLLQRAIALNPRALDGSAYITLGNLYQRLPGWPVSFGDNTLARQYLETALKLFPDALDTNYFYGNFLLVQGDYAEAQHYLHKADAIPLPASAGVADRQLKQQVQAALAAARAGHAADDDFFRACCPVGSSLPVSDQPTIKCLVALDDGGEGILASDVLTGLLSLLAAPVRPGPGRAWVAVYLGSPPLAIIADFAQPPAACPVVQGGNPGHFSEPGRSGRSHASGRDTGPSGSVDSGGRGRYRSTGARP